MNIRVGFGYDVHSLESGSMLRLGGVDIPSATRSVGHSDADVLIHALCDALLGAAGLRDIGYYFPNDEAAWAGKDSLYFLEEVMKKLAAGGWAVVNADCTVCLELPKIAPHIAEMKKAISPVLQVNAEAISIKATTGEGMGFVGRSEGLQAYAVVLIAGG